MASDDLSLLAIGIPLAFDVAVAGVSGLLVGSFLNVVIYRAPLGLSVSAPRSFCPECHRTLSWWENVPVISWLALRGHCRTCHTPISLRYPLVEFATGLVFVLVTWSWQGAGVSVGYCCLAAAMTAVYLIEYGGNRSPLAVAAIGTALGQLIIVVAAVWGSQWRIASGSLLGTAIAVLVYAVVRVGDPECIDPRGHGRSALLITGCWLGGAGLGPAAIGVGVLIVSYFGCMVAVWMINRGGAQDAGRTERHFPIGPPLVTALALAMAVSLVIRRY